MRTSLISRFAATGCGRHALAALVVVVWNLPETAPAADADGEYELVWADEFSADGRPNPENWTYERGFVRNEELQWYQPQNASCENGMLVIEARRETTANPRHDPESDEWKRNRESADYTSASLLTRGLHSWQYGRFEMRARIDTRPGLWPAFWTLGTSGEWPRCGEVDIMEYYRGDLLANVAWGTRERWVARWDAVKKPVAEFSDPEWSRSFHVWRMDWDEEGIRLYVDDQLLNSTELKETVNEDGTGLNPFHQPHYVIVNLAVGGTQGGDPSKTEFPARYEVDYIRVYRKAVGRGTAIPARSASAAADAGGRAVQRQARCLSHVSCTTSSADRSAQGEAGSATCLGARHVWISRSSSSNV